MRWGVWGLFDGDDGLLIRMTPRPRTDHADPTFGHCILWSIIAMLHTLIMLQGDVDPTFLSVCDV